MTRTEFGFHASTTDAALVEGIERWMQPQKEIDGMVSTMLDDHGQPTYAISLYTFTPHMAVLIKATWVDQHWSQYERER